MCARSPQAQLYPGLHLKDCGQQVEGGNSASLLHSSETSPAVVRPALEPPAQERHGPVGAGPAGAYKKAGEGHFTRPSSDRISRNGFKLKKSRFSLDIRKTFFTVGMVRHWHRLPREAVDAPSLEVFKARLDGALSNLV